jgi:hypothetical protein
MSRGMSLIDDEEHAQQIAVGELKMYSGEGFSINMLNK